MKTISQITTSFVLVTVLLFSGIPHAFAQTEITSWQELNNVRNDLDGSYILMNDLDSQSAGYAGIGDNWVPAGNEENGFTGTFNGNGFTIGDLVIDTNAKAGFFGYAKNAYVENLALLNVNYSVEDANTGAFFGEGEDVDIYNSYATGYMEVSGGTAVSFGGLIGRAEGHSVIRKSWSSVEVDYQGTTNGTATGGLAGRMRDDGLITESFATGNVSGRRYVGGLVGLLSHDVEINNSYARGNVTGGSRIGGLLGEMTGDSKIIKSYSTGSVSGSSNVGGLVGRMYSLFGDPEVIDSFWDTQTSGQAESDGGTGKSTAQMETEATFTGAGWDFNDVWDIDGETNNGYPFLSLTSPVSTELTEELPKRLELAQNYPNPFNPATAISYHLPENSHITLAVYNVMGQKVATLVDASQPAGTHTVTFDASGLSSGVYLYQLAVDGKTLTQRMTLVK